MSQLALPAGVSPLPRGAVRRWLARIRALVVRQRPVLEERKTLVALADRLDHPQPVEVAVVAQLRALVSDSASPVYEGGADPARIAEVTADCLERLAPPAP